MGSIQSDLQNIIWIDQAQLNSILKALETSTYEYLFGFLIQIAGVLVGGYLATKTSRDTQQRIEKDKKNEDYKKEASKFNQIVSVVSNLSENVSGLILQISGSYNQEIIAFNKLENPSHLNPMLNFLIMNQLDSEVMMPVWSNTSSLSVEPTILPVINRLSGYINGYNNIVIERNKLVREMTNQRAREQTENDILILQELNHATVDTMYILECIYDTSAYLMLRFKEIRDIYAEYRKKNELEPVKILTISENDYHKRMRTELRDFLDSLPKYKGRHLHMPR